MYQYLYALMSILGKMTALPGQSVDKGKDSVSLIQNREEGQIDFVIAWVDGSDPDWQRRKAQITGNDATDDGALRYREWGLLPYWFRAVEAFAPWVRKIHFVCDQEPPAWLNTDHPKLHIVRHEDYLPQDYRPAFSSHPIELNLHRIPGLSERFVYFNDDMYLIRPSTPEDFFRKGLPVDNAVMNPVSTTDLKMAECGNKILYFLYNDVQYLNRRYNLRECIRKNPGKWFAPIYGQYLPRSLMLLPWPRFLGFRVEHLAQPFLKRTFERAWETDGDILDATSRHHLRDDHDVNQWLLRMFQLAEGDFSPGRPAGKASFVLTEDNAELIRIITRQEMPMICVNDSDISAELFPRVQSEICGAFAQILPQPCSFERVLAESCADAREKPLAHAL